MQGKFGMAARALESMCQRNQVQALQAYLASKAFIGLQNEVNVFLNFASLKKKGRALYLLMYFSMSSMANEIAQFQSAVIRAQRFLNAHPKALASSNDVKQQRADLLTVLNTYPRAHTAAIEATVFPGALSYAALPKAGSFDPSDAKRAAEIDGTLVANPMRKKPEFLYGKSKAKDEGSTKNKIVAARALTKTALP